MMSVEGMIGQAIKYKRILEFSYNGHFRVVEPHVPGVSNGKLQFLGYQISGSSSSGGIPQWRRFDLDRIRNLVISDQVFPGRRPFPSGRHSPWDQELAIINP
ncbi:MAG: hypothetical protein Q9P90_10480 [candidate division KSB1 bacterium]|nr:hypothetical protein [candidate division KSB1 bacterium]